MGMFDWFSSGSKNADKLVDGAINGLDKMFYTDEEKADARAKMGDWYIKLQETLRDESSIRSVTRRVIAFLILGPYVLLVVGGAAAYPFNTEYAKFLLSVANGQFGMLAIAVGGFYFGPHMIGRMMGKGK